MVHTFSLVFLLILSFISVLEAQKPELLLVQLIFRHARRAPRWSYPSDPYGDPSYWPNGFGQLTNLGKQQQFQFGKWLRNRYKDFLPEIYSAKDIYVQSTDFDRTLMSAEMTLAGLYIPKDTDIWFSDIKWQPIPVHTMPVINDKILSSTRKKKCEKYHAALEDVTKSKTLTAEIQELELLLKNISKFTNVIISPTNTDNIKTFATIYDNLEIQSFHNYTLPEWSKNVFPGEMKRLFDWFYKLLGYNIELQRLKVGLLLTEMMKRFEDKIKKKLVPNRKMWMYSAHNTNIAALLSTFGAFDESMCPPFSSTLLLELSSHNGTYYISAFYKNDTDAHPISILGCDLACPFEELQNLLQPVLLNTSEWEQECQIQLKTIGLSLEAITGITCGVVLLFILISTIPLYYFVCKRAQKSKKLNVFTLKSYDF